MNSNHLLFLWYLQLTWSLTQLSYSSHTVTQAVPNYHNYGLINGSVRAREGPEAELPESKHSAHSSLTLVLLAMDIDLSMMSWA